MECSEIEAFLKHRMAPLPLRRKIAILGFIFKCVHRTAPRSCIDLFNRRLVVATFDTRMRRSLHSLQFIDPVSFDATTLLSRSIYGMVLFWNRLPSDVVCVDSVHKFQSVITKAAVDAVKRGCSISDLGDLRWIAYRYGTELHDG